MELTYCLHHSSVITSAREFYITLRHHHQEQITGPVYRNHSIWFVFPNVVAKTHIFHICFTLFKQITVRSNRLWFITVYLKESRIVQGKPVNLRCLSTCLLCLHVSVVPRKNKPNGFEFGEIHGHAVRFPRIFQSISKQNLEWGTEFLLFGISQLFYIVVLRSNFVKLLLELLVQDRNKLQNQANLWVPDALVGFWNLPNLTDVNHLRVDVGSRPLLI